MKPDLNLVDLEVRDLRLESGHQLQKDERGWFLFNETGVYQRPLTEFEEDFVESGIEAGQAKVEPVADWTMEIAAGVIQVESASVVAHGPNVLVLALELSEANVTAYTRDYTRPVPCLRLFTSQPTEAGTVIVFPALEGWKLVSATADFSTLHATLIKT